MCLYSWVEWPYFQMIFDAWLASMNVGSKLSIGYKNSRQVPSWQFVLHYGIEEMGSHGIICVGRHLVLRHPLEHRIISNGTHLLAKVHDAKLNEISQLEFTDLTCWKVDEKFWPSWREKEVEELQWDVHTGHSYPSFRFDLFKLNWLTKLSNLASEDIVTSEFHQHTWKHDLMIALF